MAAALCASPRCYLATVARVVRRRRCCVATVPPPPPPPGWNLDAVAGVPPVAAFRGHKHMAPCARAARIFCGSSCRGGSGPPPPAARIFLVVHGSPPNTQRRRAGGLQHGSGSDGQPTTGGVLATVLSLVAKGGAYHLRRLPGLPPAALRSLRTQSHGDAQGGCRYRGNGSTRQRAGTRTAYQQWHATHCCGVSVARWVATRTRARVCVRAPQRLAERTTCVRACACVRTTTPRQHTCAATAGA